MLGGPWFQPLDNAEVETVLVEVAHFEPVTLTVRAREPSNHPGVFVKVSHDLQVYKKKGLGQSLGFRVGWRPSLKDDP